MPDIDGGSLSCNRPFNDSVIIGAIDKERLARRQGPEDPKNSVSNLKSAICCVNPYSDWPMSIEQPAKVEGKRWLLP